MSNKLIVKNLSFSYKNRENSLKVLSNISFDVKRGEFISIVGPSGCGKTTLLNLIAGILPSTGTVLIDNQSPKPGGKTAFVFQDPLLFPWRNVFENISFGLEVKKLEKVLIKEKVNRVIKIVQLDEFKNYYPYQLSGGMKQRVNLGRTVAYQPDIFLLDEPFSHLDTRNKEILQLELLNIFEKIKKTFIFVTHSLEEGIFLADRIVVLSKRPAQIKETITVDFKRPRRPMLKKNKEFLKLKKRLTEACKNES